MEIITIPCLYDNYSYLIIGDNQADVSVVDPSEAWPVMRELGSRGLKLKAVLCTHHHHDHIGGTDDLLDEYPDLRVIGFKEDSGRIPQLTELLADEDSFTVGAVSGEMFHTPGHTSSSVVFHIDNKLFVGDTLFGAGCGRLFEGTVEQMTESLARIVSRGQGTELYFGHEYTALNLRFAAQVEPGNSAIQQRIRMVEEMRKSNKPSSPSTIEEELQTNPFLRPTEPGIIEYLEERVGLSNHEPVQVFTALRELRNHFS